MKVLIASDSYKGCLTSEEVNLALESTVLHCFPGSDVRKLTVADGGEGTAQAITQALGGETISVRVCDPLRRPILAQYGLCGRLAVIEVAAACGLPLLRPEERNPMKSDTYGVGELILDAARRGAREFLIGLGGSATNDGGMGILQVPGFLEAVQGCTFTVACDVDTPFLGPVGATRVFAPQKGATPDMVEQLETRMERVAQQILSDTGVDVSGLPGAGAAGGLGGFFAAYLHAELKPGIDMVLDTIGFDKYLKGLDLILTGEGRSDVQTLCGKTPYGILRRARQQHIPVWLVSGQIVHSPELDSAGFERLIQVTPSGMPLEEALRPEVAKAKILELSSLLLRSP